MNLVSYHKRIVSKVAAIGLVGLVALSFAAGSAQAGLVGQLGILDTSGINPATGSAWQAGDHYRLVFVSSTGVDPNNSAANGIAYWNAAVQSIADSATTHDLGSVTWNIIGSTASVDARDNTSTNPTVDGTGYAIMNMDGSTVIENNFTDLWNGNAPQNIALYDENGVSKDSSSAVDWPLTGTYWDGTADGSLYLQDTSSGGSIRQGRNQTSFSKAWIDANNVGANWAANNALSVYGMSQELTVTSATPEPASLVFAAGGGLLLLSKRRRRRA